jgi:hypothetical protein
VSLLALVALVKLPSCKKITTDWKVFTIREGKHRSTRALNYSKQKTFNWSIEFDSSAIYNTMDSLNQMDINKLIGWSDCWRWKDSLEIHWFKHENGSFTFAKITSIDLCKPYDYYLKIHDWDYEVAVDGVKVFVPRNCVTHSRKYQLFPYFGGDETAPHDITIKIKKNV